MEITLDTLVSYILTLFDLLRVLKDESIEELDECKVRERITRKLEFNALQKQKHHILVNLNCTKPFSTVCTDRYIILLPAHCLPVAVLSQTY